MPRKANNCNALNDNGGAFNRNAKQPKSAHAVAYDYARHCAATATACYFDAVKQYRAKEIDTPEYIEVRRAHEAALAAFDEAERTYIEACNATGVM